MVAIALVSWSRSAAIAQSLEWQAQGIATTGASEFIGAGGGLAVRTGGRTRFGVAVSPGELEGGVAVRSEVTAAYNLGVGRLSNPWPYVGGGVAVELSGSRTRAYVVLFLGVERGGEGSMAWFLEGGLGGGFRLAAGVRLRRSRGRVR
ncbi:MAG: hypothetical protein ACE5HT_05305 [Gemmatimonadales bacterium]